CGVADMQEKIIEVPRNKDHEHKNGEFVIVAMRRSMGLAAVLYGYFLPFVILMVTLLIVSELTGNEALAGLISLAILVPYYTGLYFLKDKLTKRFRFEIEKDKSDTHINL
ncbi:MAG: SoxR reducing system RseC family protein, partial [Bacteroidales bacterium]